VNHTTAARAANVGKKSDLEAQLETADQRSAFLKAAIKERRPIKECWGHEKPRPRRRGSAQQMAQRVEQTQACKPGGLLEPSKRTAESGA
jgi:hypothetical protein